MTQWIGYLAAIGLVCVGASLNAPTAPAEPLPAPVVVAAPEPAPAPAMDPSAAPQGAAPSGG
jgi:hypothetical protein